jgi:hypothetical protein
MWCRCHRLLQQTHLGTWTGFLCTEVSCTWSYWVGSWSFVPFPAEIPLWIKLYWVLLVNGELEEVSSMTTATILSTPWRKICQSLWLLSPGFTLSAAGNTECTGGWRLMGPMMLSYRSSNSVQQNISPTNLDTWWLNVRLCELASWAKNIVSGLCKHDVSLTSSQRVPMSRV